MNLCDAAVFAIQAALTDEDRKPAYRGHPNILHGQCYVASEVLYHLFPGYLKAYTMRVGNTVHWFLRSRSGRVYDPTAGQFDFKLDYRQGVGRGFLTKQPSKRAANIIERVKQHELLTRSA